MADHAPGDNGLGASPLIYDAEVLDDSLPAATALRAFEEGGRRVLIHLMKFKQALTGQFPLEAAFQTYRRAVGIPDCHGLRRKRVASLREVAETSGGAFHQTAPAGEPFIVDPPTVIGGGNHRPLKGIARSMFVACLIDARVRGRSAFIEVDDLALLDFEGDELARIDDQFELDPAVFHTPNNEDAWFFQPDSDAGGIEIEEGFALLGPWTLEFGHWMWDYLPRYVAAVASGVLPRVPVIVDRDLPTTHRQALDLLRPKGIDVIELPAFTTARVRRLWCAPSLLHLPLHEKNNDRFRWDFLAGHPARFTAVIGEMARRAEAGGLPAASRERVFLARKPGLHHPLVNAPAIEAAARDRGFAIVYPEELSFAEQVALVRNARFLLGPDGSAINFLSWFARPGTRLCTLTLDYTIGLTTLTGLSQAIGLDVTVLTGPRLKISEEYPEFVDYEIDEAGFCSFLDAWLTEPKKITIGDAARKPAKQRSTSDLFKSFENAYANLDYAGATAAFEQALENDPGGAYRHFVSYAGAALVGSLDETGRTAAVVEKLRALIANEPYLHYLSDPADPGSLRRVAALRHANIDRGLQSIVIVPQTKSASVAVAAIFNSGFQLPSVAYSLVHHHVIDTWAADYARGGACYATHLMPSKQNVVQLKRAGIDRMIVHVRDPRQALVSMVHHLDRYPDQVPEYWAADDTGNTLTERANYLIDVYEDSIDWISGWVAAEPDIQILFSTHEQFVNDKDAFVDSYLQYYGGDTKYFSRENALRQHPGVDYHYRAGKTDEWCEVLEPAFAERISAMLPDELKAKFGWSD